jgi:hypothetical protein
LLVEAKELVLVSFSVVGALRHLDDTSLEAEANEVLGRGVISELVAGGREGLLRRQEIVVLIVDELLES